MRVKCTSFEKISCFHELILEMSDNKKQKTANEPSLEQEEDLISDVAYDDVVFQKANEEMNFAFSDEKGIENLEKLAEEEMPLNLLYANFLRPKFL